MWLRRNDILKTIVKRLESIINWYDNVSNDYGAAFFEKQSTSQSPWMTLISCCDSRVQPHVIIEEPINEIFSVNVIGNAIESAAGSVDYGIYHLQTPVLLILGHTDCGAVKASLNGYHNEPDRIREALEPVAASFKTGRHEHVCDNVLQNVDYQVKVAVDMYQELVDAEKLVVVGAYFDLANDYEKGYGKISITNINGSTELNEYTEVLDAQSLHLNRIISHI